MSSIIPSQLYSGLQSRSVHVARGNRGSLRSAGVNSHCVRSIFSLHSKLSCKGTGIQTPLFPIYTAPRRSLIAHVGSDVVQKSQSLRELTWLPLAVLFQREDSDEELAWVSFYSNYFKASSRRSGGEGVFLELSPVTEASAASLQAGVSVILEAREVVRILKQLNGHAQISLGEHNLYLRRAVPEATEVKQALAPDELVEYIAAGPRISNDDNVKLTDAQVAMLNQLTLRDAPSSEVDIVEERPATEALEPRTAIRILNNPQDPARSKKEWRKQLQEALTIRTFSNSVEKTLNLTITELDGLTVVTDGTVAIDLSSLPSTMRTYIEAQQRSPRFKAQVGILSMAMLIENTLAELNEPKPVAVPVAVVEPAVPVGAPMVQTPGLPEQCDALMLARFQADVNGFVEPNERLDMLSPEGLVHVSTAEHSVLLKKVTTSYSLKDYRQVLAHFFQEFNPLLLSLSSHHAAQRAGLLDASAEHPVQVMSQQAPATAPFKHIHPMHVEGLASTLGRGVVTSQHSSAAVYELLRSQVDLDLNKTNDDGIVCCESSVDVFPFLISHRALARFVALSFAALGNSQMAMQVVHSHLKNAYSINYTSLHVTPEDLVYTEDQSAELRPVTTEDAFFSQVSDAISDGSQAVKYPHCLQTSAALAAAPPSIAEAHYLNARILHEFVPMGQSGRNDGSMRDISHNIMQKYVFDGALSNVRAHAVLLEDDIREYKLQENALAAEKVHFETLLLSVLHGVDPGDVQAHSMPHLASNGAYMSQLRTACSNAQSALLSNEGDVTLERALTIPIEAPGIGGQSADLVIASVRKALEVLIRQLDLYKACEQLQVSVDNHKRLVAVAREYVPLIERYVLSCVNLEELGYISTVFSVLDSCNLSEVDLTGGCNASAYHSVLFAPELLKKVTSFSHVKNKAVLDAFQKPSLRTTQLLNAGMKASMESQVLASTAGIALHIGVYNKVILSALKRDREQSGQTGENSLSLQAVGSALRARVPLAWGKYSAEEVHVPSAHAPLNKPLYGKQSLSREPTTFGDLSSTIQPSKHVGDLLVPSQLSQGQAAESDGSLSRFVRTHYYASEEFVRAVLKGNRHCVLAPGYYTTKEYQELTSQFLDLALQTTVITGSAHMARTLLGFSPGLEAVLMQHALTHLNANTTHFPVDSNEMTLERALLFASDGNFHGLRGDWGANVNQQHTEKFLELTAMSENAEYATSVCAKNTLMAATNPVLSALLHPFLRTPKTARSLASQWSPLLQLLLGSANSLSLCDDQGVVLHKDILRLPKEVQHDVKLALTVQSHLHHAQGQPLEFYANIHNNHDWLTGYSSLVHLLPPKMVSRGLAYLGGKDVLPFYARKNGPSAHSLEHRVVCVDALVHYCVSQTGVSKIFRTAQQLPPGMGGVVKSLPQSFQQQVSLGPGLGMTLDIILRAYNSIPALKWKANSIAKLFSQARMEWTQCLTHYQLFPGSFPHLHQVADLVAAHQGGSELAIHVESGVSRTVPPMHFTNSAFEPRAVTFINHLDRSGNSDYSADPPRAEAPCMNPLGLTGLPDWTELVQKAGLPHSATQVLMAAVHPSTAIHKVTVCENDEETFQQRVMMDSALLGTDNRHNGGPWAVYVLHILGTMVARLSVSPGDASELARMYLSDGDSRVIMSICNGLTQNPISMLHRTFNAGTHHGLHQNFFKFGTNTLKEQGLVWDPTSSINCVDMFHRQCVVLPEQRPDMPLFPLSMLSTEGTHLLQLAHKGTANKALLHQHYAHAGAQLVSLLHGGFDVNRKLFTKALSRLQDIPNNEFTSFPFLMKVAADFNRQKKGAVLNLLMAERARLGYDGFLHRYHLKYDKIVEYALQKTLKTVYIDVEAWNNRTERTSVDQYVYSEVQRLHRKDNPVHFIELASSVLDRSQYEELRSCLVADPLNAFEIDKISTMELFEALADLPIPNFVLPLTRQVILPLWLTANSFMADETYLVTAWATRKAQRVQRSTRRLHSSLYSSWKPRNTATSVRPNVNNIFSQPLTRLSMSGENHADSFQMRLIADQVKGDEDVYQFNFTRKLDVNEEDPMVLLSADAKALKESFLRADAKEVGDNMDGNVDPAAHLHTVVSATARRQEKRLQLNEHVKRVLVPGSCATGLSAMAHLVSFVSNHYSNMRGLHAQFAPVTWWSRIDLVAQLCFHPSNFDTYMSSAFSTSNVSSLGTLDVTADGRRAFEEFARSHIGMVTTSRMVEIAKLVQEQLWLFGTIDESVYARTLRMAEHVDAKDLKYVIEISKSIYNIVNVTFQDTSAPKRCFDTNIVDSGKLTLYSDTVSSANPPLASLKVEEEAIDLIHHNTASSSADLMQLSAQQKHIQDSIIKSLEGASNAAIMLELEKYADGKPESIRTLVSLCGAVIETFGQPRIAESRVVSEVTQQVLDKLCRTIKNDSAASRTTMSEGLLLLLRLHDQHKLPLLQRAAYPVLDIILASDKKGTILEFLNTHAVRHALKFNRARFAAKIGGHLKQLLLNSNFDVPVSELPFVLQLLQFCHLQGLPVPDEVLRPLAGNLVKKQDRSRGLNAKLTHLLASALQREVAVLSHTKLAALDVDAIAAELVQAEHPPTWLCAEGVQYSPEGVLIPGERLATLATLPGSAGWDKRIREQATLGNFEVAVNCAVLLFVQQQARMPNRSARATVTICKEVFGGLLQTLCEQTESPLKKEHVARTRSRLHFWAKAYLQTIRHLVPSFMNTGALAVDDAHALPFNLVSLLQGHDLFKNLNTLLAEVDLAAAFSAEYVLAASNVSQFSTLALYKDMVANEELSGERAAESMQLSLAKTNAQDLRAYLTQAYNNILSNNVSAAVAELLFSEVCFNSRIHSCSISGESGASEKISSYALLTNVGKEKSISSEQLLKMLQIADLINYGLLHRYATSSVACILPSGVDTNELADAATSQLAQQIKGRGSLTNLRLGALSNPTKPDLLASRPATMMSNLSLTQHVLGMAQTVNILTAAPLSRVLSKYNDPAFSSLPNGVRGSLVFQTVATQLTAETLKQISTDSRLDVLTQTRALELAYSYFTSFFATYVHNAQHRTDLRVDLVSAGLSIARPPCVVGGGHSSQCDNEFYTFGFPHPVTAEGFVMHEMLCRDDVLQSHVFSSITCTLAALSNITPWELADRQVEGAMQLTNAVKRARALSLLMAVHCMSVYKFVLGPSQAAKMYQQLLRTLTRTCSVNLDSGEHYRAEEHVNETINIIFSRDRRRPANTSSNSSSNATDNDKKSNDPFSEIPLGQFADAHPLLALTGQESESPTHNQQFDCHLPAVANALHAGFMSAADVRQLLQCVSRHTDVASNTESFLSAAAALLHYGKDEDVIHILRKLQAYLPADQEPASPNIITTVSARNPHNVLKLLRDRHHVATMPAPLPIVNNLEVGEQFVDCLRQDSDALSAIAHQGLFFPLGLDVYPLSLRLGQKSNLHFRVLDAQAVSHAMVSGVFSGEQGRTAYTSIPPVNLDYGRGVPYKHFYMLEADGQHKPWSHPKVVGDTAQRILSSWVQNQPSNSPAAAVRRFITAPTSQNSDHFIRSSSSLEQDLAALAVKL